MAAASSGGSHVRRLGFVAITPLMMAASLHAQTPAIDDLKGKIFDARMTQQTFAGGMKFCSELDGSNFYFQPRDRVLNLEAYSQSLENLVQAQTFNPAKRRPWSAEDAKERRDEVKKEAQEDRQKCELVRSLPELERQLRELQNNTAASETPEKKQ
jgi:hypothetical protein